MDNNVMEYVELLEKALQMRDELITVLEQRESVMEKMLALKDAQVQRYEALFDEIKEAAS